ncbi:uncharacterized protein Dmoj_GI26963 [Drosophila mojavensis]|uniref:Uncharacterized protein n=1 Tax=Drosophila mojavensis TaxID=7230 RepID=A0A0Q9XL48_DROMO|nr:uncharacterized protein Dmoj_GI26963 [Drosophila mojavensis]
MRRSLKSFPLRLSYGLISTSRALSASKGSKTIKGTNSHLKQLDEKPCPTKRSDPGPRCKPNEGEKKEGQKKEGDKKNPSKK